MASSSNPTGIDAGHPAGKRRPVLPLLRSPPFPATPAAIAAVSVARTISPCATLSAQQCERARLIIAAIAKARVGGSFWGAQPTDPGATGGVVDPWHVIAQSLSISAAGDDEIGLLAAIAGLEVSWTSEGLFADFFTDGQADPVERAVTSWLIDGADYRDPYSGRPVPVEAAIDQLAFWRAAIDRNRGVAVVVGMASWKRREVEAMLWPGHPVRLEHRTAAAVKAARRARGGIATWVTRKPRHLDEAAAAAGIPLYLVEDGFLRSAGLGSECHPPHSIILDRTGLHLDPKAPCDLETLIAEPIEDAALLARAEQLTRTIVDAGISKYAVGGRGFERPPEAQRLVLVVGQVEDDLSVQLGGAGITSNLELLRRARAAEPDAYLLFKPHPDVDAGHRRGRIPDSDALAHVDRVVRDVPMASLLDVSDAVHVLTSLAGFEALMRGCEVIVHGQPFYAGWGLTRDLAPPIPRRGARRVTRNELVAAVLLKYPRYLDPQTKLPCPPEVLAERLMAQPVPHDSWLTRARRLQGKIRRRLHTPGTRA